MAYALVKYSVKDHDKWKPIFDNYGATRKNAGCKGGQVFHAFGKKNDLIILFEWDTKEHAANFFDSEDTKKTQQSAGVIGKPEIHYMEKVENFSA